MKRGGKKLALNLCRIYNACSRLEYFPNQWKIADIIMIPKPNKDPKVPSNHRPIRFLNTMEKLFEKLLLSRLNENTHCDKNQTRAVWVSPPSQYNNSTSQIHR